MIIELIQARGSIHVHLTPGELNGLLRLTQAIGRAFWHLTPAAQSVIAGIPEISGFVWLARWDPLGSRTDKKGGKK